MPKVKDSDLLTLVHFRPVCRLPVAFATQTGARHRQALQTLVTFTTYPLFDYISSSLNFHSLRGSVCRMKYYPICLDISNRRCVVIGGGDVAERKVTRLLEYEANVAVVGKTLTRKLEALKNKGEIDHIASDYRKEYVRNASLVIGATDSDNVNERIYRDARKIGILVNIVDDPDRCDFILPSLFQQGDLQIAISSGGKSPALAKRLREKMEDNYGPEYKTFLDIMGAVRERVIARGHPPEENKKLFESLINSDILQYIRENNWKMVRKIINDLVGENVDIAESDS